MSALGAQTLINSERAFYLSSIPSDVIHSTIQVQEIDASIGRFSTLIGENITASTMSVSTLNFQNSDVSGMYVSSIRGNEAFFSSMTIASDLSGGVGFVRFHVDASGVQVDGDPIRFDNLVYLTSTINIIQVSTLVDTDIFASNGYFSTLSSGSLSTGQIQFLDLSGTSGQISSLRVEDLSANYGAFNNLFVSSLEALDISGVASGKNWSLYPTLNSSIIFQPAYILSNINNTLWFAGNELTDASGGGQDWSVFPAFSTVLMANNSMTGISTLRFQDGGTLTSLTGNNLLYNGQPVNYGTAQLASNWANYPAVANVNMSNRTLSNVAQINGSNLALSGSNITNGNTFTNSLGVGGTSLVSLATIDSGGDITCRNLQVGDAVTGLADVEIYGATALPGDNALYVEGGVTCDGGTIHGFTAGVLPVAGINTGRIDMLQAGFNLLHPLVGAITTGAAMAITAGGALSMAAGGYLELNTSTLQMINTSQGNKNTTIQAGYLTVDPDVANTQSIKLFNTLGGGVEIDGGGQGSLKGFSTVQSSNVSSFNLDVSTINGVPLAQIQTPSNILASNVFVGLSTITSTLTVWDRGSISTLLWTLGAGISTVSADYVGQRLWITDRIIGSNNIGPVDAQILNFSSIQSGTMSTTNINLSTINGVQWDISGFIYTNFSSASVSSLKVSTMSGYGQDTAVGSTIFVEGGIEFVGQPTALPAGVGGRFLSSLRYINSTRENLDMSVSTLSLLYNEGINPDGFVRIGGGGAFDSYFIDNGLSTLRLTAVSSITQDLTVSSFKLLGGGGEFAFNAPIRFTGLDALDNVVVINTNPPSIPFLTIGASTMSLAANNVLIASVSSFNTQTSSLQTLMIQGRPGVDLDISGDAVMNGTLQIPLANGGINFDDGSFVNYTRLMRRDIANNNMLGVCDTPALGSNNMVPFAVGELWLTGGADQYPAVRYYNEFPYNNFGLDQMDANGAFLWNYMYGEETPDDGWTLNLFGVSSMTGTTGQYPGADPRLITNFSQVMRGPQISTLEIQLSSINGINFYDISGANIPNDKFSTATISSLSVSSINGLAPDINGEVPIGGIIMYSGSLPIANWALCDGTNGTPDLRAKFVLGGGGTTFPSGTAGGSSTITVFQMPSHSHNVQDPGHAHDVVLTGLYNNGESGNETVYAGQARTGPETRQSDPGAAVSTFTNISLNNTGGGQPYYPPYYVLAYIMRIS